MKVLLALAATMLATSAMAQTVPSGTGTTTPDQTTSGVPGGVRPDTANPTAPQTVPDTTAEPTDATQSMPPATTTMSTRQVRHHATGHRKMRHQAKARHHWKHRRHHKMARHHHVVRKTTRTATTPSK